MHKLSRILADFKQFAAKFQAEHGHPAVLVFDNINAIAKHDPGLLWELQSRAKESADEKSFKVVFVCSDGVAPALMKGKVSCCRHRFNGTIANPATANSSWSRGPTDGVCRIGDLTQAEAKVYLTEKRKLDARSCSETP